jgi:hypothetical protein
LKYSIHQAARAALSAGAPAPRFVLYLPFAEQRLTETGDDLDHPLDLLMEYRYTGATWRVGGKRPTVFSFLRQIGVPLPDNPADQRRLYEGGKDSLLAKYAAAHATRPADFWQITLTPELAQSRLIGDLDQTILNLADAPEESWQDLCNRGLGQDFLDLVRDRYGFEAPLDSPERWMSGFVETVALTEAYLGYQEPPDFPFLDRLPAAALRPHHAQLLERWLRDTQYRPVWDGYIGHVEARVDLSAWAQGRDGSSYGLPHLVRVRWNETLAAFEVAAGKASQLAAFFAQVEERLAREVEFGKGTQSPTGSWSLLRELQGLAGACRQGEADVQSADALEGLAKVYVTNAHRIEGAHLRIRRTADEEDLPVVRRVADSMYADYALSLNNRFFEELVEARQVELPGIPPVTERLEKTVWRVKGRRAVVIVDALRYDCAHEVAGLLRDCEVSIEPLQAVLPTVTPVGMTALLPLSQARLSVELKGNSIHPLVDGQDMAVRENRRAFLQAFGADCQDIAEVESRSRAPAHLSNLLVVMGHDDLDTMGHGDAAGLARHLSVEMQRIARLVRKLHAWGYPEVHVITDHGFVVLEEDRLPDQVTCEKDWCHVRKERFALVSGKADVPLTTFPFPWDTSVRVAVPPGLAFFAAEKSFSHGGASLQELIIPHLVSTLRTRPGRRVAVEVIVAASNLLRASVKVTLRPKPPGGAKGQARLFAETGRTLALDVLRRRPDGEVQSVLASGPREARLEADGGEQSVTLFFSTGAAFRRGEELTLDIRDVDTSEQSPAGGVKLTVARDM